MATDRTVSAAAKKAARARARPKAPLKWSEALKIAPVPTDLPPVWESTYRRAFAQELVKLGHARPAAKRGGATPGGETKLATRPFRATPEEFREHDAKADAAGISWNAWMRRKASEK